MKRKEKKIVIPAMDWPVSITREGHAMEIIFTSMCLDSGQSLSRMTMYFNYPEIGKSL